MKAATFFVTFLLAFVRCLGASQNVLDQVVSYLPALHWNQITVLVSESEFLRSSLTLSTLDITWRLISNCNQSKANERVIILDQNSGNCFHKNKFPFSSILVLNETIEKQVDFPNNFGLYVWQGKEIKRCFSINHQLFCFKMDETLDFKGLTLKALYSDMANGDHFFYMTILEHIVKEYNFTIEYHQSVETNWGAVPKAHCNWTSIECFEGIFQEFIAEEYDFMANMWAITPERQTLTSHLQPLCIDYNGLYLNSTHLPREKDWTFYFRPFHYDSWILLLITYLVMSSTYLVVYNYLQLDSSQSTLILSLTAWLLYILLAAFYGGAITMFLSTPKDLHIKSALDVLQSQDYKLLYVQGYDLFIETMAEAEIPEFVQFKKQLEIGYEHSYETLEEALKIMETEPGTVLSFPATYVTLHLNKTNGGRNPYLTAGQDFQFKVGILTKKTGWPLKTLFNKILTKVHESGLMQQATQTYFEPKVTVQEVVSNARSISMDDVLVGFILFSTGLVVCLLTFMLEFYFFRVQTLSK